MKTGFFFKVISDNGGRGRCRKYMRDVPSFLVPFFRLHLLHEPLYFLLFSQPISFLLCHLADCNNNTSSLRGQGQGQLFSCFFFVCLLTFILHLQASPVRHLRGQVTPRLPQLQLPLIRRLHALLQSLVDQLLDLSLIFVLHVAVVLPVLMERLLLRLQFQL